MAHRVKRGRLVEVQFLDHAEDSPRPMRFTVWGRVWDCCPESITVACFDYTEPAYDADDNVKRYVILQAAITKLRRL